MTKSTHLAIAKQFPEFFREEYPAFVQFIEEYYKFLDTTYSGNLTGVMDLDVTDTVFLNHYRAQYAVDFPEFENMKLREFIRHAKEFYTSKGTEKSLKFLFRLLFNEELFIDYPGKYTLKASDGRWNQEFYFTVRDLIAHPLTAPFSLKFSNSYGLFYLEVKKVEQLSQNVHRFYFDKNRPIVFDNLQTFYIESESGEALYVGELQKSPSRVTIVSPGKYWQRGQVLSIPGPTKNSIARVTRVDENGGLKTVELLEFGYTHEENQIQIISPFPNKPTTTETTYIKTLTNFSPMTYTHELGFYDYLDGATDQVIGISDNPVLANYFLEDYVEIGYLGSIVIAQKQISPEIIENAYSDITMTQWLESRATIVLQFDYLVKSRGHYIDELSLISNKQICLQDNDYYQQFSYQIETIHDQREFESTLQLTHPAGTKWFSSLRKQFTHLNGAYDARRTISLDTLYLSDELESIDDSVSKHVTKVNIDALDPATDYITKGFTKVNSEIVRALHDEGATTDVEYYATDFFSEIYTAPEVMLYITAPEEIPPPEYTPLGYTWVNSQ